MRGNLSPETDAGLSPVVIAAHELKTPLVLLRQLALSLEDDSLTKSERATIASHMKLVSERALRLTSDLTKVQRLEDALFEMEPLNAQQICEEVLYELSPLYKACGREIRLTRRRSQVLAVANRDLLRRVLLNFADNALHYGEHDEPVQLSVQSRDNGEVIRLGVRDYGPAVATDLWQSIDERAFQPEAVQARPASSGLGLMIAQRFARSMNAKVGTLRHRDGATFFIDVYASKQLNLL